MSAAFTLTEAGAGAGGSATTGVGEAKGADGANEPGNTSTGPTPGASSACVVAVRSAITGTVTGAACLIARGTRLRRMMG